MTANKMWLYKRGAKTGREIARRLGIDITTEGHSGGWKALNWGCGTDHLSPTMPIAILNTRRAVQKAIDKRQLLNILSHGVEATSEKSKAKQWASEGFKVYCRTLGRANRGRGVVVATTPDEVVNALFYTKGAEGREYRVHVFQGEVLAVSRKMPKEDVEVNEDVRNNETGWYFSLRNTERVHEQIKEVAIRSMDEISLDFGAIDLMWDGSTAKVLEINTAPALSPGGTIINKYVEKFREWCINTTKSYTCVFLPTDERGERKHIIRNACNSMHARQICGTIYGEMPEIVEEGTLEAYRR